jgi:hypothetical protein
MLHTRFNLSIVKKSGFIPAFEKKQAVCARGNKFRE